MVVKAPSGDKCSKSKMTPHVHFISFKFKYYVISWLLVKRPWSILKSNLEKIASI